MEFQDRQLTCVDCGQPFVFTAGEQEFYARKGFKEEPKRCKICREARKARRAGGETLGQGGSPARAAALSAGVPDDAGNRAPHGPREVREVGGRGRNRELFDAICAQCGAETRVPFRPTSGRPVYCRDCFAARGGRGPDGT